MKMHCLKLNPKQKCGKVTKKCLLRNLQFAICIYNRISERFTNNQVFITEQTFDIDRNILRKKIYLNEHIPKHCGTKGQNSFLPLHRKNLVSLLDFCALWIFSRISQLPRALKLMTFSLFLYQRTLLTFMSILQ